MVANFFVHLNEQCVRNAVCLVVAACTDIFSGDCLHKVSEERNSCVCKEVASVFCSVGNDFVHLVEAAAVDEVCNERNFMEWLVVCAFRFDACVNHCLECPFASSLDHGDHENTFADVFLLG